MSKVYSFRLDVDNPREAQAIEVIENWVSQGYFLRQILTDALIQLGDDKGIRSEWDKVRNQISELVDRLENNSVEKFTNRDNNALSQDFVLAMKKAAKTGILLE